MYTLLKILNDFLFGHPVVFV